jgi:hypothetical protein
MQNINIFISETLTNYLIIKIESKMFLIKTILLLLLLLTINPSNLFFGGNDVNFI